MVEVFKTNVENTEFARTIIDQIQFKIKGAKANFDLSDCDAILRVENTIIDVSLISQIVSDMGFLAIVL